MGDILHALPAITALRKTHPAWRIGWAVEPRWRGLLSAAANPQEEKPYRDEIRPIVDQLHFVPAKAWGRKPLSRETRRQILALRSELRQAEYEAVLDLQGSIRSAVVSRLSGCRRILGSAHPWESQARWFYSERVETTSDHVIEQAIELARAVAGDLLMPHPPQLPVSPEAEDWCLSLPERVTWSVPDYLPGKPLVLINPGAGWGAKRWPAERYGVVAEALGDLGASVLVNVGPGEEALASAVIRASHGRAAPIECTLEQLIAVTRRVSLVIGGDTGPLHLACALGKPVVGIYGPTDPKRNGPYGTAFRVLRNPESRRDHTRRAQPEVGLLTIEPHTVIEAALELIAPQLQPSPATLLPTWEEEAE